MAGVDTAGQSAAGQSAAGQSAAAPPSGGNGSADGAWTAAQRRAQYGAIARLRWRITVNNFRRKGGAGEIVARVTTYPLMAALALGPTVGVGIGAYYFASQGRLSHISWLLWGTFALCQVLNIQLGQPGTTFDPTQLIRFPMSVRNYAAIRLFFGLLTPANVIGALMSLAIALGTMAAQPALWLEALVALAVFAAANTLFSRMVFAWVDRWLSTRRAREVLTGLIFAVSIGFQFVDFSFNSSAHQHHGHGVSHAHVTMAMAFYHRAQPFIAVLPPELTSSSLVAAHAGRTADFFGLTLACAAFAAFFLAVFALRMRTEFRGENLSNTANAVSRKSLAKAQTPAPAATVAAAATATSAAKPERGAFGLSPAVAAILGKEFLYVRRNTGIFYSLVAPVVLVFLYTGMRAARGHSAWIFPAAVAYALLGVVPLTYNSFGLEATGAQFYFMAPVRMRDVFLAKNLMNFALAALEVAAVLLIVCYVSAVPSALSVADALLWAAAALLYSTTIGNLRSITAPKKIDVVRMGSSKQASPLSALISMGVLMALAGMGAAVLFFAHFFDRDWIALPIFAVLAAVAAVVYLHSLASLDRFTLAHRDELFEELCKK